MTYEVKAAPKAPSERKRYPFAIMKVGDFFEAPVPKGETPYDVRNRMSNSMLRIGKRRNVKFVTRTLENGNLGVWCQEVEPETNEDTKT